MNQGLPVCPQCGETGNRPGAKFCMSCGQGMTPEPAACPKCGEPAPALGAKFCNSCGAPMAAAAAFEPLVVQPEAPTAPAEAPPPEPRRRSFGLAWAALFLVLIGGGFAAYWFLLRVPGPRLVVWSDDAKDLEIAVVAGAPVPRDPQGGYSPSPGPCVVTVSKQGKPVETHKFTIQPGALHLCVIGGAAVDAHVSEGPRLQVHHPWPGALYACAACRRLDMVSKCPKCGQETPPLSPKKVLTVQRAAAVAADASDESVILANPYAADLAVTAKTATCSIQFPLPRESIRAIPYAKSVDVKCAIEPDGATLEERELKPPPGVSLYTVGGATWFEWLAEDGTPVPEGSLPPESLAALKTDSPLLAGDAGKPGLLRREKGGKVERLVAISSLPLLPPSMAAVGKVSSHPGVEISEVTLPGSIAGKTVEAVAAGDAGIVVIVEGSAHALATGERLHDPGPGLRSVAIASDGLFFVTRQSSCATLDGRKILVGSALSDPTLRPWAPRSGASVFLHGGKYVPGLLLLAADGPKEILPGLPAITGLGSTKDGVLVARGRAIERMTVVDGKAKLEPVIVLPDGPPVIGVHDAGGPLVFATDSGLFMLTDNVVVPIAQGVGGSLYPCKGGVLLHDRASRRLFRLTSSLFKES